MANLWQQPYVNVFKHFNVTSWKKSAKEGEVSTLMDKQVKATVLKVTGHIPAGNYVQLPRVSSQSLNLTGRYFYLLFRPIPTKYFVVHIDVVTNDSLVIRLSFSNLFKEFKSTSTWLQFPFLCNPSKETVAFFTAFGARDHGGPAPPSTRWTILCLDLAYILSTYLNRRYSHIKTMRLCANMFVKNVFTSDILYDPDISLADAKKMTGGGRHTAPLPRDFGFPLLRGESWHDVYDLIRFPPEGDKKPFDSVQYSVGDNDKELEDEEGKPRRIIPRTQTVSKCVSERVSMIHKLTTPKEYVIKPAVTKELPEMDPDKETDESNVHICAHPLDADEADMLKTKPTVGAGELSTIGFANAHLVRGTKSHKGLEPDPILKLKRIIGFGGGTFRDVLWSGDRTCVIYPFHAMVVVMKLSNGHQRFFFGHTSKVSCLALTSNSVLLASGQTGQTSVVRIWKFQTGECLVMAKAHCNSMHSLSFSKSGNTLCVAGKDDFGKNMVIIWNTESVLKKGVAAILAKAHTDVDITRMVITPFDDMRMVSCGHDNVRLWRVKNGTLRSASINLNEYKGMEFTDICFEGGPHSERSRDERLIYVCSRTGHVFEIDYKKVAVHHVRRLLPIPSKTKGGAKSDAGLAITSISMNETFCATGSEDGFLRLWPLDFAHVYLEAEHDGPVTAVSLSSDGLKILAGTATGNLGVLNVSSRDYTTIMRSHASSIISFAIDPFNKHITTVSQDHSIRVWDSETLQQLYDFSAPGECPTCISYHPHSQIFACGFENGAVRVFNVESTCLVAEHKLHKEGTITGVVYAPHGQILYSCCSQGTLVMYDATQPGYPLLRYLNNMVARGKRFAPEALTISESGRRLAFVGPTNFTVTVVDGQHLSEMVRVDISCLSAERANEPVDTARHVLFAPAAVGHLLVSTTNLHLIKVDPVTGKILDEVSSIHRLTCTAMAISANGKFLVTAGDQVIKVWDYSMKLDINFQVFIGHTEPITKVLYSADMVTLVSTGEGVFFWNNLGLRPSTPPLGGRTEDTSISKKAGKRSEKNSPNVSFSSIEYPRRTPPKPTVPLFGSAHGEDLSPIQDDEDRRTINSEAEDMPRFNEQTKFCPDFEGEVCNFPVRRTGPTSPKPSMSFAGESRERKGTVFSCMDAVTDLEDQFYSDRLGKLSIKKASIPPKLAPKPDKKASVLVKQPSPSQSRPKGGHPVQDQSDIKEVPSVMHTPDPEHPSCSRHFKALEKHHLLAQRRYTAPPNQSGIHLNSIVGYNGNGRDNMVWNPDTGLFVYTSENVVILEDLSTSQQSHLHGHHEEISTIAVQYDNQVLVSASGPTVDNKLCQICVWDLVNKVCKRTLYHHAHQVVSMAYSRDDRYLLTMGDYQDLQLVVWQAVSFDILNKTNMEVPIHSIRWDPYAVNEFCCVGECGSAFFFLADETGTRMRLSVHEGSCPPDLIMDNQNKMVAFTNLEYSRDSILYIPTTSGKVLAFDNRHNTCFMHWDADTSEIDIILSGGEKLVTGSEEGHLRLWVVSGINHMRTPGEAGRPRHGQGVIMEDEMILDGAITAASFDENLEMGIVGTSGGTVWYINWVERTSIRLVAGHADQVTGIAMTNGELMATSCADGCVRVWVLSSREQCLQFQVKGQSCTCLAFAPTPPDEHPDAIQVTKKVKPAESKVAPLVAGYSDGTLRLFDINAVEMQLKLRPHNVPITAVAFSADAAMMISGSYNGVVSVSSVVSGMTVKIINDHRGAPITAIDVAFTPPADDQVPIVQSPQLWLACSADRRVSIWSSDWHRDICDLVDWMSFPAPAFTPEGEKCKGKDQYSVLPPTLAKFSTEERDIIVYTGYGMNKSIQFYSIEQRKMVRSITLTHWAKCMDLCYDNALIAVGIDERLLKLIDYYEGSFQDFTHGDRVTLVRFSHNGSHLVSATNKQMLLWDVTL